MDQIIGITLALIPMALTLTVIALDIWAITDLAKHPIKHRSLWIAIIILLPIIGALAYLVINRKG